MTSNAITTDKNIFHCKKVEKLKDTLNGKEVQQGLQHLGEGLKALQRDYLVIFATLTEKEKISPTLVAATNQKCQELKTSISYVTHLSQFRACFLHKVSFHSFPGTGKAQVKAKERYNEETLSRLIQDLGKVSSLA